MQYPVDSLYFVLVFEDVTAQLPASATMPACCWLPWLPGMMDSYPFGTRSPNALFPPSVALVMMFHHSSRKITNTKREMLSFWGVH